MGHQLLLAPRAMGDPPRPSASLLIPTLCPDTQSPCPENALQLLTQAGRGLLPCLHPPSTPFLQRRMGMGWRLPCASLSASGAALVDRCQRQGRAWDLSAGHLPCDIILHILDENMLW